MKDKSKFEGVAFVRKSQCGVIAFSCELLHVRPFIFQILPHFLALQVVHLAVRHKDVHHALAHYLARSGQLFLHLVKGIGYLLEASGEGHVFCHDDEARVVLVAVSSGRISSIL